MRRSKLLWSTLGLLSLLFAACEPAVDPVAYSDPQLDAEPDGHAHPGFYAQWFEQKKDRYGRIPHGMYSRWHAHDQRQRANASNARTAGVDNPITSALFLGPHNVGGRTRAIVYDWNDANRIFAGGVSGGLWRSDDAGASWNPINDAAVNLSVTSITQSPFDADIFYYGTGESAGNSAGVAGDGVFKSTDGGLTFTQLSSTTTNTDFQKIYKVEHDVVDPLKVYVGTRDGGCYRTTDAGVSWEQVHSVGKVQDIVCLPNGAVLLGIRSSGIYRSPDGSAGSFVLNTDPDLLVSMRRIEIANCATQGDIVYAGFEGASGINRFDGFYISTDGGVNWDPRTLPSCGTGQNSYNLVVGVHPTDPDTLMAGAHNVKISLDGALTWQNHRNPHQDNHAFAMHPSNPDSFIVGNDGGLYAFEWAVGSPPVRSLNRGYAVSQFYGGGFAPTGSVTIGGLQDNGTLKVTDLDTDDCGKNDGGYAHVHQQNPDLAFRSWQGHPSTDGPINMIRNFSSADAGNGSRINNDVTMNDEKYNFINYYQMNYFDSDQLYVRTNKALWRTVDTGATWARLTNGNIGGIQAIGVSEESDPVVYFGGANAKLFRINGAATAVQGTEVSLSASVPANVAMDNISSIILHPHDNGTLYVSFGNNSTESRVFKVTDALTATPVWTDVSGDPLGTGLPEGLPVNYLQIHPQAPDEIFFAGTDFGLYYTVDGGVTWCKETTVPNVVIFEAKLRASDRKLFLFTHGRGIWELSLKGCDPIAAAPSYSNSLEQPMIDGWINSDEDDFDWTRQSGATPTANTGPAAAFDGTYYGFAEASAPNNPAQEAWLVSPCFDVSGFNLPRVEWQYHMRGADIGTLWLDVSTNSGHTWSGLTSVSGDQGNMWNLGSEDLTGYIGETNMRFRFRAITGTGEEGDIAVDWFQLTEAAPRMHGGLTEVAPPQTEGVEVFPNPFAEVLRVRLPAELEGPVQLILMDLQGREVLRQTVRAGNDPLELKTDGLARGAYMLRISGEGLRTSLRVVRH